MSHRGKSHSVRPASKRAPSWMEYVPEDVEAFVIKLLKDGNSTSKIGIILRDQYGIPLVKSATGKTITQIIKEAALAPSIPEELNNLIRKAETLRIHLEKNKTDSYNKRSLELIKSKIRRLSKYYINRGDLPKDWEYKPGTTIVV